MLAAVAAVATWEESWEDPGLRFQEWLRDCVLRAVRAFCQQGKPGSLKREESVQVYRKAVNVVLDNELKASPCHVMPHALPMSSFAQHFMGTAPDVNRLPCMHQHSSVQQETDMR